MQPNPISATATRARLLRVFMARRASPLTAPFPAAASPPRRRGKQGKRAAPALPRAACPRAHGAREGGHNLDRRRQRSEDLNPGEVDELRKLLEAERHLAPRHQRPHRDTGRRRDDAPPHLFGNPQRANRLASWTPLGPVEYPMVGAASTAPRSASSLSIAGPRAARRGPRRPRPSAPGPPRSRRATGDRRCRACQSRRGPAPRRRRARPPARAWRRRRRPPIPWRPPVPSAPRRRLPAPRAAPWWPSMRFQ